MKGRSTGEWGLDCWLFCFDLSLVQKETKYCTDLHCTLLLFRSETQSVFLTWKTANSYPPCLTYMQPYPCLWIGVWGVCVCGGGTVRIKHFNEIFTPMVLTYILESLWVLFNFIHSANHPRLTLTPTPAPWAGRERAMQRLARHQESESRIERK